MEKKEIQELRMKGYFIEATKSIIQSEGVGSVSVRNIADQAGYSFATLYNYFKDVKVLIFECVKIFQTECEEFVKQKTENIPFGKERIKVISKAYIDYFLEYPGIFDLFFVEKLGSISNSQQLGENIFSFLNNLCEEDWALIKAQKSSSNENIERIQKQLNFTTAGMLVLYMNRLQPSSYQEFQINIENQISFILKEI
jgi:AcrR family transcriptional regulator